MNVTVYLIDVCVCQDGFFNRVTFVYIVYVSYDVDGGLLDGENVLITYFVFED